MRKYWYWLAFFVGVVLLFSCVTTRRPVTAPMHVPKESVEEALPAEDYWDGMYELEEEESSPPPGGDGIKHPGSRGGPLRTPTAVPQPVPGSRVPPATLTPVATAGEVWDYAYLEPLSGVVEAYHDLSMGKIVFPASGTMLQGATKVVNVRVFSQGGPTAEVIARLNSGFGSSIVEDLRVSYVMCADLISLGEDVFGIRRIGERCQIVIPPYTDWRWVVTALKSGEHNLNLTVINEIHVAGESEVRNEVSRDAIIRVRVSLWYVLKFFFANNWQWLVSGLGGLIGTFVACKKLLNREKKRKAAGF